ncbi:peroxisomal acyl-coenzyme A oxidase 3 isoform X1 [Frankliniella occidentalis]|uniref:Acyl-coenzyme A oxidase n=2 Tax=Frankliniella occidentalis TaxID=133901 RepID=A0A9C6X5T2_FRAOC|nr:peroxisomal acyl-coenzyme A oxidase 3 isoform X1 [Frankliniella occidentalis]
MAAITMGIVDVRQPLADHEGRPHRLDQGLQSGVWRHDLMQEVAPDLPVVPGPLSEYRQQASFDWKQLRIALEDPEILRIKMNLWRKLEADPVFAHPRVTPPMEEQKKRVAVQLRRFLELNIIPQEVHNYSYKDKTKFMMAINAATSSWNKNLSVKFGLGVSLFTNALLSLGTERHLPFYDAVWDNRFLFALGMTEVGHGSNTKQVRTTATYDPPTQSFIIHTPDFEAAKCWAGNLGKTCTHIMLFAQLITADDTCHGLHAFLVPIRDPETLSPYPGIRVGDIGEKIGLNGIDNGFAMFDNYRIPRENLLNRTGDVTAEGEYESCFQNPEQILGAALENLLAGRVAISQESTHDLCTAVTISVRYAAVRKQGGPRNAKEELSILEYPLHQWRLFPYVAAACVFKVFIGDFTDQYLDLVEQSYKGAEMKDLTSVAAEVHAMVSATKPLITWTCASALQESREACGGHGYLKASQLGIMRADHDATVTYEGDNNVLLQQTSNWIVRNWPHAIQGNTSAILDASPFGTLHCLINAEEKLKEEFTGTTVDDVLNPHFVKSSYEWLVCWLTQSLDNQLQKLKSSGLDRFTARAQVHAFYAKPLALAYGENSALSYFWEKLKTPELPCEIRSILERLYVLYGLWGIQRNLALFYKGGFASGSKMADLIQEACQAVCGTLKPEIVAVIDAIAHPDSVVKSILGRSDGKIYDHLYDAYMSQQGNTGRPTWWHEVSAKTQSKL